MPRPRRVLAISMFAGVPTGPRIARVQADVRALAVSVSMYSAHMGSLPAALNALTSPATNAESQDAGPFMVVVPVPPAGWGAAYAYEPRTDGGFVIWAVGNGTTVITP